MTIAERIERIRSSLPSTVRLIGVSKGVSPQAIREAYAAGLRDFAESRLQEALPKREELGDLEGVTWHFIGRLQANKVRKTVLAFDWIHSLDNLELAQRLDRIGGELGINPRVLLQVKPLPDPQKQGWEETTLRADLPDLESYKNLKIQGLMTILPLGLSPEEQEKAFEKVRDLGFTLEKESNLSLTEFSMGMSGDYPAAVRSGATMVRLGTIIFGDRA